MIKAVREMKRRDLQSKWLKTQDPSEKNHQKLSQAASRKMRKRECVAPVRKQKKNMTDNFFRYLTADTAEWEIVFQSLFAIEAPASVTNQNGRVWEKSSAVTSE